MPLGDQNGDGCDDLMIADLLGRAFLYYGTASADTIATYELKFEKVTYFMNNIGDVSGDTYNDFLIPRYFGGVDKLDLYFGGPLIDTITDARFGLDALSGKGHSAFGFDYDQDGIKEIVSLGGESWSALFYEWTQPSDSVHDLRLFPANLQFGVHYSNFGNPPSVGLFNGDSEPDLALGLLSRWASDTSGAVYFYWGGPAFDTIPDMIITRPGGYVDGAWTFGSNVMENVGDLNNDGYDDIFASAGASGWDSTGYVFFGGPTVDTIPEVVINDRHNVARAAGDLNHDGYDDLITGYGIDMSTVGGVYVYYGGPEMDSIPDIVFTNQGTPGVQTDFGLDVTGVGDFNNDGINDFAFSFEDGFSVEWVLIYSGTDLSSVDYEYDPALPSDYSLSHNFPNPFNPVTIIQFSIPGRSHIALAIYNILGTEVRQLAEGTFSAGSYTVQWDGRAESGRSVASGVYLYRLTADGIKITRKMVLLK